MELKLSSFPILSELMDPGIRHQRLLTSPKRGNFLIMKRTIIYEVNLLKKKGKKKYNQVIMLYTLNSTIFICHLYLNKTEKECHLYQTHSFDVWIKLCCICINFTKNTSTYLHKYGDSSRVLYSVNCFT